jgi:arylsulfatase A-like enzyme
MNQRIVTPRKLGLALALLVGLALVVLYAQAPPPQPPPPIVILSLDTLRADHLSAYGYSRPTSPTLDRLAADSIRFTSAHSQSSGTLPSHLSLLTSLNPPHFQITRKDGKNVSQGTTELMLPESVTTLAETLRASGYETIAFTDGGPMSPRYGHNHGFDRYEVTDPGSLGTTLDGLSRLLEERGRKVAASDSPETRSLFLFLHTFDVHEPYSAPEPFSRAFSKESFKEMGQSLGFPAFSGLIEKNRSKLTPFDLREFSALYDNGILWADDSVSKLLELLEEHGLYRDAIIVVLSDHGEEFLDHGSFNHGATVYQELVHVPLILRLPGGQHAGRVVEQPVALIDVAPTVLDIAGIEIPEAFQGTSLLKAIETNNGAARLAERPIYFESPRAVTGPRGLRRGDWKLIRNAKQGTVELYDLSTDPHERNNLALQAVDTREELSRLLSRWIQEMEDFGRQEGWSAVPQERGPSEQELETLRALGYIE